MALDRLREYLDGQGIKYVVLEHSRAYTAQEIAATAHVSGRELAKTVMVRLDGKIAMAVLPASYQVDFELLRRASGARKAELAREADFAGRFPDCDVGAMPPFGNLYDIDVYVAQRLTEDEEIAFNACSHTHLLKMAYADFARLVRPKVVRFATVP
jgi:Ala-tRNA(Pro) deacylase